MAFRLFRVGLLTQLLLWVCPVLEHVQKYAWASIFPAAPLGLKFSLGTRHTDYRFSSRPFKKFVVVITAVHHICPVGIP